jgi:hypothetical protein
MEKDFVMGRVRSIALMIVLAVMIRLRARVQVMVAMGLVIGILLMLSANLLDTRGRFVLMEWIMIIMEK